MKTSTPKIPKPKEPKIAIEPEKQASYRQEDVRKPRGINSYIAAGQIAGGALGVKSGLSRAKKALLG